VSAQQLITDEKNLFVGRVKPHFFRQSAYVGAILTEGHPVQGVKPDAPTAPTCRLATSRCFLQPAQSDRQRLRQPE
jgi:hypothetical protein